MNTETVASSPWPGRTAWWLFLLLLVFVGWQLGRFTWALYQGPEALPVGVSASASDRSEQRRSGSYALWNLFGRADKAATPAPASVESAPETRLRLDLYGVVVGTDGEGSGAIVAERGKEANYFRIGDTLPGNVRLAAVYPDKILLDRGGVMETLSFDDTEKAGSAIEAVAQPAVNTAEDFVQLAEQRLSQDALGALGSVGLEPAQSAGGPAGYVFNGNNPMLSNLSLQAGDVIRSVNGHVLGDLEQDRAMIQQFYESGMLEVEVERDGAIFSISYPLR